MDTDKVESIPRKADRTISGLQTIYTGNCWDLGRGVLRNFKTANYNKYLYYCHSELPLFTPVFLHLSLRNHKNIFYNKQDITDKAKAPSGFTTNFYFYQSNTCTWFIIF